MPSGQRRPIDMMIHKAREYTVRLMEAVDDGMVDKDQLIRDLVNWMSEQDVKEFVEANVPELIDEDDE